MTSEQEPLMQRPDAYSDNFVTIDGPSRMLSIKHYHLLTPTLKVFIPNLVYIHPASEVVKRIGLRQHGLSSVGIRWARDWSRGNAITGPRSGYDKSFVIKVQGGKFRSGFSVQDPDRFIAVLERVCSGITNLDMGSQEEDGLKAEMESEQAVFDYEQ